MLSEKTLLLGLTTIDIFEKRFVDFVCGKRDTLTFSNLYNKLKNRDIELFCSDYWKSYNELILVKNTAQTFTIEGYNSLIRIA